MHSGKICSVETLAVVFLVAATSAMVALSGGVAAAATSQWQDIGGGKARLVAVKNPAEGTLSGLVEVQLNKGWKTYWRAPGSSGIPPEFDFTGSAAIDINRVRFPAPKLLKAGESSFFGYTGTVAFPFYGLAADSGELRLDLLIGVCEEICIPATARLALAAGQLNISDPNAQTLIMLAESLLPNTPSNDLNVTGLETDDGRLELEIRSDVAAEDIRAVIWPRNGKWVSDPVKVVRRDDGSLHSAFEPPLSADLPDPASGEWHFALIVLDAANGAVKKTVEGRIEKAGR